MSYLYSIRHDGESASLRRAIGISMAVHLGVLLSLGFRWYAAPIMPSAPVYEVRFVTDSPVETPEPPVAPPSEPVREPPPPPEPPKEEPKPEPKPKPALKPKEEEKPKEEPKPKEAPKPKPKPTQLAKAEPKPEVSKQTGVTVKEGLPNELSAWARLVQRKVEKFWQPPAGIRLDIENNQAMISFWVDREGNLMGEPEIVKHASDEELGLSGARAIRLAAPLPPLPDDFKGTEQEVVYVFTLVR
ncbi:MAG: TonB C-terminal domain-containing protein [Candidatus Hydrogenedentes bacterium]|nr:TonB C-terminal domain-containing protein [Candidatus Hydrogenedentota bacterium]